MKRVRRSRIAIYYPFRSNRDFNAVKRAAEFAVKTARLNGTLVSQPCERCHRKKTEAHHDDYTKPLEIRWLCRHHHRQRDAELREQWREQLREAERNGLPVSYLQRFAKRNKQPVQLTDGQRASLEGRHVPRRLLLNDSVVGVVRQATSAVADAMDAEGVSESALSRRVGTSRQHLNNVLASGVRTIKLLAAIADALGYDVTVHLHRRESKAVAS